ncbi:acyl-CoA dehydrogenase [Amycolatopsis magusensis]|uniref:Alkylation response protein AidB-like acyl-CoA dehydrogenase n=1 Tax=Amycolatopsis magusensis TaxID=882444 RepID=A0ABS4Q580_9PSEU|nr:acyl-CoA dehydrogenase [Amycolatopsis magusensis]MBP2185951.1 alkylation response protein AidB-like acyl-CoA dehydrogenase [Amycolatopsis magusensis]
MPIAITEEQRALADSIRAWAADDRPVELLRGAQGFDGCLVALGRIGLFSVAVPEALGGAGAGVVDAASGLEVTAEALVPGPVFSSLLAALVLGRAPDTPAAKELVPALTDGLATAAVAWTSLEARPGPGGSMLLSGDTGPVLDADSAAHLLLHAGDQWFVLPPGTVGVEVTAVDSMDLSRSLGTIRLIDVVVPADALIPVSGDIRALAATLACAEAAGITQWCLRTAVDYAKVREQFGRPIGSFQAIKHLCAEMLCRAEATAALAWDAARAADESDADQQEFTAATAAGFALDAAVENAKDCIQVLGGIGFTWEHDAHLYLRRAVTLRQALGGGAYWRRRAAELALGGVRRVSDTATASDPGIRALAEEIAALPPDQQRRKLAETGLLTPHWPEPYGLGASAARQLVIDAELDRAGVTRPELIIGAWAAPTILEHGTDAQREKYVGPTLRGEITWCQLFSEPGAGSDLASLRTKAIRVDGGWRISGQKVWTSLADQADWGICLARTDPEAPQHRGITYFLVDMRADGIEIRPLREITGEARFNEVFLEDVFVPDEQVVGEVNGGWRLARTTLANERVAMGSGTLVGEGVERLVRRLRGRTADPLLLDRLGALIADGSAGSLLGLRGTLRTLAGQDPGPESSVRKLIGVRHRQEVAETALEVVGPQGESTKEAQHEFLVSRCLSIAGGTTQVLRNVAAERLLGLPRA